MSIEVQENELETAVLRLQEALREDQLELAKTSSKLRELLKVDIEKQGDEYKQNVDSFKQKVAQLKESIAFTRDSLKDMAIPFLPSTGVSHSRTGKLPSDLPVFVPDETNLERFFGILEAKLRSHSTPPKDWHKALGKATTDAALIWVSQNILKPQLQWEQAKIAFSKEFGTEAIVSKNRDKLMDLRQEGKSCGTFLREVEQLAQGADQSVNDQYFLSFLRRRQLDAHISRAVTLHLGQEVNKLTFKKLKTAALFVECALSSRSGNEGQRKKNGDGRKNNEKDDRRNKDVRKNKEKGKAEKDFGTDNIDDKKETRIKKEQHNRLSDVKCFRCGQKGHYANTCTAEKKENLAVRTIRKKHDEDEEIPSYYTCKDYEKDEDEPDGITYTTRRDIEEFMRY
jgi:hypothetical protein